MDPLTGALILGGVKGLGSIFGGIGEAKRQREQARMQAEQQLGQERMSAMQQEGRTRSNALAELMELYRSKLQR